MASLCGIELPFQEIAKILLRLGEFGDGVIGFAVFQLFEDQCFAQQVNSVEKRYGQLMLDTVTGYEFAFGREEMFYNERGFSFGIHSVEIA